LEPLFDLAVIWLGVFFAVYAARKTNLTPVLYFLFVGAVFVNLGILPEKSEPFIRTFAEVGIIVTMFALGFEENTSHFVRSIKRSWGIAFFGAIAPFATAYGLAEYFWNDFHLSIICGLAMTATAVSLTMVSLKNEGLQKTNAATGIMTSAVLDDIGSLAMLAILIPVATGEAPATILDISLVALKAVAFFAAVTLLGVWVFPHEPAGIFARIPFLRTVGIKHLFALTRGEHTTLTVLIIALLVGILAHELGFHPAVGAYMAGLILKEEYFQLVETEPGAHYNEIRRIVDNVAYSWIGPVFFVDLGTKIVFDWHTVVAVIPQTIAMTVGLFVAQIASAGLAARYTGGFTNRESLMIGFGMLGRAELAFVVMDIAYVQTPILSEQAFYTLMITAFWLNVSVPLTIKYWKPYFSGNKPLFEKPSEKHLP